MTNAATSETDLEFAIFGSCVTRDPFQFAKGVSIPLYCARQSIASSASARPSANYLSQIKFANGIAAFHQRSIESDIGKTALGRIRKLSPHIPIVIDLIEERCPLGVTPENTIVTLSEAAQKFSNLPDLVVRQIAPWSDEYIELFRSALPKLAAALEGRKVVIHRALYAENLGKFPGINAHLRSMYDDIRAAVPSAASFDLPADVTRSEPDHMWGYAPFHYIDDYYTVALDMIESLSGVTILRKSSFSLMRDKSKTG